MPTFVDKLAEMLDIEDTKVDSLIKAATLPQLISLSSAVTNNNKEKAIELYKDILGDDNFYIGQQVSYGDKKAIVAKPDIGGDMIQISQNGELDVVKKSDIEKLDEDVFGLNSIPGISRMKVLAGIKPMGSVGPAQTNDPSNPKNTSNIQAANQTKNNHNQPTKSVQSNVIDDNVSDNEKNVNEGVEEDISPSELCFNALDIIEDNINDAPISDLSAIRQRLNSLFLSLNENVSFRNRK